MNSPDLSSLPIQEVLPHLLEVLSTRSSVVLRAPTGAGKTTRVPPAILRSGLAGDGQIVMLEPRRIAARAAAVRMAQEMEVGVGREVGYSVRFDSKASDATRILVVTEGVLLRRLQLDSFLDGVSVVVFDEFHERNLASDLALGMVRRIQQTVRPDLKIVVMSATLDPVPIAAWLGAESAVVESQGRSFPVDVLYQKFRDPRHPLELVTAGVEQIFHGTTGHLLVFLPGVGEIHRAMRDLEEFSRRHQTPLLPLYGDLPPEEQDAVLNSTGGRKIILATNVAETSVTIPGVTAVVDTGVAKVMRFDPVAGLDRLVLEPISQASADQRAGRAGRTQPGVCLRLWDEKSHRLRSAQTDPEIKRVDLAGPVLQLLSWGERDVQGFPWLESPPVEAVEQALLLLRRLGGIDEAGEVTPLGYQLVQLPVHPRIARMLIAGHQEGVTRRAAWLAALLEERDPFFRPRSGGHSGGAPRTVSSHHSQSDVLDRLAALEEAERGGSSEFPWGVLNRGAARQIGRVRDQLLQYLKDLKLPTGTGASTSDDEVLSRALVAAFPDRVAKRRSPGSDKGLMVGGRGIKLAPQSSVRSGELLLCVDVDAGKTDALVRQASLIQPEWLPSESLRTQTDLFFHPTQKQVVARRREYFDDLVLAESPVSLPDGDGPAIVLFDEASRAWDQVFPVQDPAIQGYLQRIQALSSWMPELELPAFEEEDRLAILRRLCASCRSFSDLKKADWLSELKINLSWNQQQSIDKEAPEALRVPSGSMIRLEYEPGRSPVMAVRIQELFGMAETPRIAGGRVRVLLHLLAPNRQPQQVTEDLASFWANTYPTVRKEMARRYPRHPWPENPLTAPAIRK
ncbi:ATP-dependent helicase HrpB [Planctomicrobium sp. SH668]|uniref:ATP-dependent helicase HrpB n=1 Tax=Planctomicrobium sp. SH668 TaxID=3448126 RepID=UPI003F5B3E5F